jgi:hypothetical protein
MAEPGKIKAQNSDAIICQRARDFGRGKDVLGAGKAVRKKRIGSRCAARHFQTSGKLLTEATHKRDTLCRHGLASLPS